MLRRSDSNSKYRPTPSRPVKVRPRNGAKDGWPCSWTVGRGLEVKWLRMVEVDEDGEVKAVMRDWTGSRREALVYGIVVV